MYHLDETSTLNELDNNFDIGGGLVKLVFNSNIVGNSALTNNLYKLCFSS